MRKYILITGILLIFAGSYFARRALSRRDTPAARPSEGYRRIVSLAPSITEELYALGLGDRVVGVTRYCDYPPEARTKPQVGGYYDPNYEAIIALKPDLVVMVSEHVEPQKHFEHLGIPVLTVNHKNVPGILDSIAAIGRAGGAEDRAEAIIRDAKERIARVQRKVAGRPRPTVLISVGRNMGSGTLKDAYISGKDGFYDTLLELAGGVNVYTGDVTFPVVDREGIMELNPDIIIDMVSDVEDKGLDPEEVRKQWTALAELKAVKNNRVHIFGKGYHVVPGPRFILTLEDLARVIHPEVKWDE